MGSVSHGDAQKLGDAGITLLELADDDSLWRDFAALVARARVLAVAKTRRDPPEPEAR